MPNDRGEAIHLEAIRASGTGDTAFVIYKSGKVDPYTLKTNEFVTVTDVLLGIPAGGAYAVVADTDAAGKRIIKGTAQIPETITHHFETPWLCPMGVTPVFTAATTGAAYGLLDGFLCEN